MSGDTLGSARGLVAQIVAARDETESERRLPDEVVRALVSSRICRGMLPTELGGLALEVTEWMQVLEVLAGAEASVAWVVWNNALPCLFSRHLDPDVRREIFGDAAQLYASSTRPTGRGVVEDGGYRLSGRWSLVSGCLHADWIGLMYLVEKDGEVQLLEGGMPEMRMALVPEAELEVVDTWHVGGLRGTGSHDIVADDVVVPAARSLTPFAPSTLDGPLGSVPTAATMSAGHASICLGIAQAGIEALLELARSKVSVDPTPDLRDRPAHQRMIASATTKVAAQRAYLRAAMSAVWAKAGRSEEVTPEDLAALWSAAVVAAREARSAVSELYEAAGTTSLYADSVLERHHRDIHAAMQHIIIQSAWLENAGRVAFGLEPASPLFAL